MSIGFPVLVMELEVLPYVAGIQLLVVIYRRLRSLSTGAYRSNSGGRGAKKRAGAY